MIVRTRILTADSPRSHNTRESATAVARADFAVTVSIDNGILAGAPAGA
ncbi:hypothetical protein [Microlunatus elymi]|nr:hypothetical protein [Microlunatus elymi]